MADKIKELINRDLKKYLRSPKGIFFNGVVDTYKMLRIFFVPLAITVICDQEFDVYGLKVLTILLASIIVLPIAFVYSVYHLVVGVLCAPFALIFEGIPYLFSKKYRQEFKLSRKVKEFSKVYKKYLKSKPYLDKQIDQTETTLLINRLTTLAQDIKELYPNIDFTNQDFEVKDFENEKSENNNFVINDLQENNLQNTDELQK